jgi:phenylacetate-coenzyme A ligase PaaK-like adenylate-forming protein
MTLLRTRIRRRQMKMKMTFHKNELEVSGLTPGSSGKPNMEFATDEQDMDLIEQLYTKSKHKPLMGEGAYWNDWE